MAVPFAGRTEHFTRTFALPAGDPAGTPALLAAHQKMPLARSVAVWTLKKSGSLARRAVYSPVPFASGTEAVAKGAETLADMTDDLGFHLCNLLTLPESFVMEKYPFRQDTRR